MAQGARAVNAYPLHDFGLGTARAQPLHDGRVAQHLRADAVQRRLLRRGRLRGMGALYQL